MSAALSELAGTPQDPLLGQIVSTRYQIDSFISAGGMGLVYKARHIVLDKPIALKVLREVQDYDAQQRFPLFLKSPEKFVAGSGSSLENYARMNKPAPPRAP